jgi:mono/diheme cytochrome c family protein
VIPTDKPHQYDPAVADALWNGDDSKRGAAVYIDNCAACHRTDGHGYTRVFPALAGNPVLQSAKTDIVDPYRAQGRDTAGDTHRAVDLHHAGLRLALVGSGSGRCGQFHPTWPTS